MNYYTIKVDDTIDITDISLLAKDFISNPVSLELADTDYLYVGYYKKFKQFYVELDPVNTESNELGMEYWNGTSWAALVAVDETLGFTKSGFIYFDRPTDWEEADVDGDTRFYIRLQPSVSHSVGTILQGLGVLFSNDLDLIGIRSNIVSKHNNGDSWIGKHEAARKLIIQKIRNGGKIKVNEKNQQNDPLLTGNDIYYSDITEFDLHEPFELREASKFYALSLIYLDELSDEEDDKWQLAGKRHEARADEAVQLFMLKLDTNDDGEENENESEGSTDVSLTWA